MVGGSAGGHVAVRVHAHPGDVMPGVMGELREERPLGAAVALHGGPLPFLTPRPNHHMNTAILTCHSVREF